MVLSGKKWGKLEMFIGEYRHNLDEKGRIAVPVKFRENLKAGAVVTKGLDSCLFLYPKEEWQDVAGKLSNLPISQSGARAFARLMLAGAYEVDIDKQGRIVIPQTLREFAGIKGTTVVAGLYNRIEVWESKKWEEYQKTTEKESNEIAEKLSDLGV
ncbi:MAG: division/cell wall cluster transcriptional repressor MraZ [Patescibacteria group bacterium]|nr:division/cell wall cluster transcriptional repressor MraZ [Patescibacteria group bacterium]